VTRVELSPRAVCQIEAADEWWREHRPAAPLLFVDELEAALERLAVHPRSGRPYPRPRYPDLRRLVLTRTRYHIYYEYLPAEDVVWVEDVWSAVRGEDPPL
jgi:plasmid stabilization system protein ParE